MVVDGKIIKKWAVLYISAETRSVKMEEVESGHRLLQSCINGMDEALKLEDIVRQNI